MVRMKAGDMTVLTCSLHARPRDICCNLRYQDWSCRRTEELGVHGIRRQIITSLGNDLLSHGSLRISIVCVSWLLPICDGARRSLLNYGDT